MILLLLSCGKVYHLLQVYASAYFHKILFDILLILHRKIFSLHFFNFFFTIYYKNSPCFFSLNML